MTNENIEEETDQEYQYRTIWESEREAKKLLPKKPSKRDVLREHMVDVVIKQYFCNWTYQQIADWLASELDCQMNISEVQRAIKSFPTSEVKSIIAESFLRQSKQVNEFRITELSEIMMQSSEMRKGAKKDYKMLASLTKTFIDASQELERIVALSLDNNIKHIDNNANEKILEKIEALQDAKRKALEFAGTKNFDDGNQQLCDDENREREDELS